MDTERLRLVLSIIDKVLSLHPAERSHYLDDVCGDDSLLRKEIEEMVESANDSEKFWNNLQDQNNKAAGEIFENTEYFGERYTNKHIGPWRLLKPIGEGGMGVVYLAERDDGNYRQRVALKLLRQYYSIDELDSSTVHRFRQERQILAKLDHPNIARLYDGGYTSDGLPWLAMEYVDGLPIHEWCRQNSCSLKDRLNLFKKICEAIKYAHKNLIVHRDLKPDNILVTTDGEVKILDFGIAKLLDEEPSTEQRLLTRTGLRAMSLHYAAPEQITGDQITTATDVYALGLVLYELITGHYPFILDGLKITQIERVIRSDIPAKPSSFPDRDKNITGIQEIRGDLDAITMKALRKESDQRYENAGALLDEILRYEDNRPVEARRDSQRYRMSKFIRRHRRSLSAGVAIVLSVAVFLLYHTWQLAQERDIAQREAARAEQIATFLADMFKASDPSEARGEELTARELLDAGAERIHLFVDQPEVQATMMQLIGRVYWGIGAYEDAIPLLEQAIELRRNLTNTPNNELALAHFTLGMAIHDMGDYQNATPHFEEAVTIYRMYPDQLSAEYATSLENMGNVEEARRKYNEAELLHREALEMRLSLFGPDHPDVGQSYFSIGTLRYHQNDLDGSIEKIREALRIFRYNNMTDTRLGARTLRQLGNRLIAKGEYEQAESVLSESLQINRRIHGDKYLDTGLAVWSLATLNRNRGRFIAAEELYKEAVSILSIAIGNRHVMVGQIFQEFGDLYMQPTFTDYNKAVQFYGESIEIFENAGRVHPSRIVISNRKMGLALIKLHRFEEAEANLLENLNTAHILATENEDHRQLFLDSLQALVELYGEWGKMDKAMQYSERLAAGF